MLCGQAVPALLDIPVRLKQRLLSRVVAGLIPGHLDFLCAG